MKKVLFSLLLLMILLVTACQSEELVFSGEGKQWSAKVAVSQTDGEETYTIEISYEGDDVKTIETFRYDVESNHNEVLNYRVDGASLNEEGVYKSKMLSSNSASTTSEDELVLEVEWNGESETFNLRNDM